MLLDRGCILDFDRGGELLLMINCALTTFGTAAGEELYESHFGMSPPNVGFDMPVVPT